MSDPKTLIFAKKFRLPSPAANIIQTLNMAWGFQSAGAHVHLFPGFPPESGRFLLQNIETEYHLEKNNRPHVSMLPARHKGIYGTLFRFFIFKAWFANPDAIFFSRDVKEAVFLLTLRKIYNKNQKIIYEMHDSVFLEHLEYGKKDAHIYEIWEKRILTKADAVVYTGIYLKKQIENVYPVSTPSFVAVPGFNKKIFIPLAIEPPSETITLGYFGSLHPAKGLSLLIEVFKKLPASFRLRIVGGNPENHYIDLQERVQKEIERPDRIEFTGQVSPATVRDHLVGCHMLVIPFISEVEFLSPIKLYEALGMGLPVVATPISAIRDAADELPHVVLSVSSNSDDIAIAIQSLGNNPDRIKNLHNLALKVRKKYYWETRAKCIYERILSL